MKEQHREETLSAKNMYGGRSVRLTGTQAARNAAAKHKSYDHRQQGTKAARNTSSRDHRQ